MWLCLGDADQVRTLQTTVRIWALLWVKLEKAMASHSSTLAWKIPWTEEPGRLCSMGSRRVGHYWETSLSLFTFHFLALEKEMTTHSSVLAWRIPGTGDLGGLPSMGSHRVRHDWSDLAAAAVCLCSVLLPEFHYPNFYVGYACPKCEYFWRKGV